MQPNYSNEQVNSFGDCSVAFVLTVCGAETAGLKGFLTPNPVKEITPHWLKGGEGGKGKACIYLKKHPLATTAQGCKPPKENGLTMVPANLPIAVDQMALPPTKTHSV
jgi:hypothetical protein